MKGDTDVQMCLFLTSFTVAISSLEEFLEEAVTGKLFVS